MLVTLQREGHGSDLRWACGTSADEDDDCEGSSE